MLDIGCGTGSVSLLLQRLHPETAIVGLEESAEIGARMTPSGTLCFYRAVVPNGST